jgi:hypothetical protein
MRNSRRRFCMLSVGKRGPRVVLGLQGSQTGAREFMSLQVRFRPGNGRLRCIVFRGTAAGGTRRGRGNNGLARVAHFLYGRRRTAAKQTGNSNQHKNDPRHRLQ